MIIRTPFDYNFTDELKSAKQIWFAIALINDDGYKLINSYLQQNCKCNFLVGTNLPSAPTVLRALKSKTGGLNFKAKIFTERTVFHPKVYILEKESGTFVAFVGSSNATNGGFNNNVEVNYRIDNQIHCKELISWFNKLYSETEEITEEFLDSYEEIYIRRKRRAAEDRNDVAKVQSKPIPEHISDFKEEDFSSQYFSKRDFEIYSKENWFNHSREANDERKVVQRKLLNLHEKIYPQFKIYDLTDLHKHYQTQNITSVVDYRKGWTKEEREAIWLHYGKNKEELKKYSKLSFIDHCRIQIILRDTFLGIWLVVGKNHGSKEDRAHFQNKLKNEDYQDLIFNLFKELGVGYEISNASDSSLFTDQIKNKKQLIGHLRKDDLSEYYVIKNNYPPDDIRLSTNNIESTVLNEFSKLYRLYDVIRDKR